MNNNTDIRRAFSTAHESAVRANSAAREDVVTRTQIKAVSDDLSTMKKYLNVQNMYLFSAFFVVACIGEGLSSIEAYKLWLSGTIKLGPVEVPYALFAVLIIVSFGIMTSHLLRFLKKDINEYEQNEKEVKNQDIPLASLLLGLKKQRDTQNIIGFTGLVIISVLLSLMSFNRKYWEAKSMGRKPEFDVFDFSPVIFFWAEVALGVYLTLVMRHISLLWKLNGLKIRSKRLRAECQEQTHLVAAAVIELTLKGFDWQSDGEISIAMLRNRTKNSSDESYTDPIVVAKVGVVVRDSKNNVIENATINGITSENTPTDIARTNVNGNATLNWLNAPYLTSIFINGKEFKGEYQNGTSVTIVFESHRSIGF